MRQKLHLLIWCAAVGIAAFACLNYYSQARAPLYKKFEQQWLQDVQDLEASKRLPKPWFEVKNLEVVGGTPETKEWLSRIKVPLKINPDGGHHLDVLVVAWEEEGKRGALVQYNLVDLKTRNNIWELGRTFILSKPRAKGFQGWLEEAL